MRARDPVSLADATGDPLAAAAPGAAARAWGVAGAPRPNVGARRVAEALAGDAAGGQEIDRYDPRCGSPPHALVLATADGFDDGMLLCKEELGATHPCISGSRHPDIRADMVFFETAAGGAVFSVGSISWATSLMVDGGDNDVSRVTSNVLRRFRDSAAFRMETT